MYVTIIYFSTSIYIYDCVKIYGTIQIDIFHKT